MSRSAYIGRLVSMSDAYCPHTLYIGLSDDRDRAALLVGY